MVKKFNDYVRRVEKIDPDELSDEEIFTLKEDVKFQIGFLQNELARVLGFLIAYIIIFAIFLNLVLTNFNILCIIIFVASVILMALTIKLYVDWTKVLNQLYKVIERLMKR